MRRREYSLRDIRPADEFLQPLVRKRAALCVHVSGRLHAELSQSGLSEDKDKPKYGTQPTHTPILTSEKLNPNGQEAMGGVVGPPGC